MSCEIKREYFLYKLELTNYDRSSDDIKHLQPELHPFPDISHLLTATANKPDRAHSFDIIII